MTINDLIYFLPAVRDRNHVLPTDCNGECARSQAKAPSGGRAFLKPQPRTANNLGQNDRRAATREKSPIGKGKPVSAAER